MRAPATEALGGGATQTSCSWGYSRGGFGGSCNEVTAQDGTSGEPASDPPSGAAGLGEESNPACTAGNPGADGVTGPWGLGGGNGHFTAETFVSGAGTDGLYGYPGQGGGGGGATFGNSAVCAGGGHGGGAGGSGGAGGCGGTPGTAGQGGGASFAFAIPPPGSWTIFESVTFATGHGGHGGHGGKPQAGGPGGGGGAGGKGAASVAPGCAGGAGGHGGDGGWGGGGAGGPVAAVATGGGPMVLEIATDTWDHGPPGKGGEGDPAHGGTSRGREALAAFSQGF